MTSLDGAVAFALEKADAATRCRWCATSRPRTRTPTRYFQFARNTVKAMAKNFPAPARCVDCVEQAVKAATFEQGLAYERSAFLALIMTPECKALRHAFFGERAASKIPDVPDDTPQRAIKKVARHRRRHDGRRHRA